MAKYQSRNAGTSKTTDQGTVRIEGSGMSRRQFIRMGTLAGVSIPALSLLAAACGSSTSATTTLAAGAIPGKPNKIIIRTWGDPWKSTYADGAGASFTAKTGIPVEFDVTGFSEIQTKVQQAVAAGQRPPVDAVLTIEERAFAAAAQGISVSMDRNILSNLSQLSSVALPADGGTNYVSASTYSQPLVYAPDRADLKAGMSWGDIWDSKYEGRLFVTDTPSSLLMPVAAMLGLDVETDDLQPVWDKIAELRPNIAATGDEEEFLSGIDGGEFDVGITLAATALEAEGLKWVTPKEGSTVSTEAFWVPTGLPEETTYWTQVFINETLAAENQTLIAENLGEVPTNLGAALPAFMLDDPATFPFTEEDIAKFALVFPVEAGARNNDEWQAAYTAAIQG